MYLLRNVCENDLEDLYELSGTVFFINLPHDKDIILEKITKSQKTFKNPSNDFSKNFYMFVLEDLSINKVIGVSLIHAQHGTEKEPHFFLTVSNEHKYSQTINTGFVHGTLKLGLDTDGPTEIGGLVVDPKYRGIGDKLGKQISFVRFLYMGMNKDRFKQTIHSELMPPLDANGDSPLWEAIGRRFMNMDYAEADALSRSNKEFILSLYPSDNIYMTLLPYEARNAIGKVGKDTLPVKNMLEKIGFHYTNEVDPFDGGPHYRANINDIVPIKESFVKALSTNETDIQDTGDYLINFETKDYEFVSLKVSAKIDDDFIYLPKEVIEKFSLTDGQKINGIPF